MSSRRYDGFGKCYRFWTDRYYLVETDLSRRIQNKTMCSVVIRRNWSRLIKMLKKKKKKESKKSFN